MTVYEPGQSPSRLRHAFACWDSERFLRKRRINEDLARRLYPEYRVLRFERKRAFLELVEGRRRGG